MVWIRRGVIAALAALVVVMGFSIWRINAVAERVIEGQGTAALGVDTTIDFISIGFLPLSLRIAGFEIENPDGYRENNFFTLGTGTMRVDVGSLREETVVAPELRLHGVDVSLERDLRRTNYGVILRNLHKTDSGRDSAPPASEGGPGKRFRIDRIVIEDVTAHLAIGLGGEFQESRIRVPEIVLTEVGGAEAAGVVAGELLNAIIVGILDALAHSGEVPARLAGDLAEQLAGLTRVTWQVSGDVVEVGGSLLDETQDTAADAAPNGS
jgi:hypothetical protein